MEILHPYPRREKINLAARTLNHELGSVFKQWYPDMEVEELPDAA